jgi:uncharacterized membrane protein YadS
MALAVAVALAAMALEPWLRRTFGASLPGMVLALVIGILLNPIARNPVFKAGFDLAVKRLLRYAIALLGLRIALSDIAGLGWPAALLAILAMAATVAGGPRPCPAAEPADGEDAVRGELLALREAVILCPNGYAWVPSRRI